MKTTAFNEAEFQRLIKIFHDAVNSGISFRFKDFSDPPKGGFSLE